MIHPHYSGKQIRERTPFGFTTPGLQAARALLSIGNRSAIINHVVPLLKKYVTNRSYGIEEAIWILEDIGKDSKPVVPVLLDLMEKYNNDQLNCRDATQTYIAAIRALSKIDPNDSDIIQALIKQLQIYSIGRSGTKDRSLLIRRAAIEALGNIGTKAKDAVPLIILTLKDYVLNDSLLVTGWENEIWELATKTLGNIGPEAKSAIPFIIYGISKLNDREIVCYGHLALYKIIKNNLGIVSPGSEWWQWSNSDVNIAREKWLKWWEENKKGFTDDK